MARAWVLVGALTSVAAVAQVTSEGSTPSAPAAGQLTRPPELLTFVEAKYPPDALAEKIQGEVVLTVDLSATGEVTHVEVATPAGHGFDDSAVEAVRQFRFSPAEI